jgi:hypothetical protein
LIARGWHRFDLRASIALRRTLTSLTYSMHPITDGSAEGASIARWQAFVRIDALRGRG